MFTNLFKKKQSFIKKNTSLLKLGNTMQVFMKKHSSITSVQSSDTLLTGCIIVYGGLCPLSKRPRAELPPEPQEGGKMLRPLGERRIYPLVTV